MTFHISNYESEIQKNTKAYCMERSIILPHVRYIDDGDRSSLMYHSRIINSNGHCYTLQCDRMGVSGLCSGHKMSRKEFIESFCDGIEPETKINLE
jgi:hypothetical protein